MSYKRFSSYEIGRIILLCIPVFLVGLPLIFGQINPKLGLNIYKIEARAGSRSAAYNLGLIYEGSRKADIKVTQNYSLAANYFKMVIGNKGILLNFDSVRHKHQLEYQRDAMYHLANFYEQGLGVVKDKQKAISLYKQSMSLGSPEATYHLGRYYETGDSYFEQDLATTLKLYNLAEKKGYYCARDKLGVLYATGKIVKQDDSLAMYMFRMSLLSDRPYFEGAEMIGKEILDPVAYANYRVANSENSSAHKALRESLNKRFSKDQLLLAENMSKQMIIHCE